MNNEMPPTSTPDPRDVVSRAPMSRMQVIVVAITVGLNALDGFDVLSISFAYSPNLAKMASLSSSVIVMSTYGRSLATDGKYDLY